MSSKSIPNEYNFLSDAISHILENNYFEALSILQNCESFIQKSHKPVCHYVNLTVMHNTSLCFYRLKTPSQSLSYLTQAVKICKNILKKIEKSTSALRLFKYISLTHLRISAIFSQEKNHEKALKHSQSGLRYLKEYIINTVLVISHFTLTMKKKNENNLETLLKISSVLDKIISKKFKRKSRVFYSEEWLKNYNISDILTIQPVLLSDWTVPFSIKQEINLTKTLENICLLIYCYFSISTEMRFLVMTSSADRNLRNKDWHERALDICKNFLPSACPIHQHIKKVYQKHYMPAFKNPSPAVKSRFHSKRESEKLKTSSVKILEKPRKTASVRKKTPVPRKNLMSSQKVVIKKKIKGKASCGSVFTRHPIMSTHKVVESSESEKSFIFNKNFVLTSNDLYGDYSVNDEERSSTIIKKDADKCVGHNRLNHGKKF